MTGGDGEERERERENQENGGGGGAGGEKSQVSSKDGDDRGSTGVKIDHYKQRITAFGKSE